MALPARLKSLFFRRTPPESAAPRRWLPVVDTDGCSGCGLCLEACEHGCFEMVWDFATLVRPESCEGEGQCAQACREEVIRMGWVSLAGDRRAGTRRERPAPVAPSSMIPDEDLARTLLTEMLSRVRHSGDTPLDFGIDAPGIAAAALERCAAPPAAHWAALEDQSALVASVDRLAREALEYPDVARVPGAREGPPEHWGLCSWLERVHRRMAAVHPLAPDILGWRVEGEGSREIADRLGLGLRLTERITADMRAAWTTARP